MNIRTDYLETLQRQQETGRKSMEVPAGADGFAALFSQEIGQNGQAGATGAAGAMDASRAAGHGASLEAAMLVSGMGDPAAAGGDASRPAGSLGSVRRVPVGRRIAEERLDAASRHG